MGWKFFKDQEVAGLSNQLVAFLDSARAIAGIPITITSGLRSVDANDACGGVHDSAHCSGEAVDFACVGGDDRLKFVAALVSVGFKRIGLYDHHIHVDVSKLLPQNVMWIGVSH